MKKREEHSLKKDKATLLSLLVLLCLMVRFRFLGIPSCTSNPFSQVLPCLAPLTTVFAYSPVPGSCPSITQPHGQAPFFAVSRQHCGIPPSQTPDSPTCVDLHLPPWTSSCLCGAGSPPSMSSPRGVYGSSFHPLLLQPRLPLSATVNQITVDDCVPSNVSHFPECIYYFSLKLLL